MKKISCGNILLTIGLAPIVLGSLFAVGVILVEQITINPWITIPSILISICIVAGSVVELNKNALAQK